MFILSLKSLKGKLFILVAAVLIAAAVLFVIRDAGTDTDDSVSAGNHIDYTAETNEDRLNFISQTGLNVNPEPVSVTQVMIPAEFNEVYSQYNILQTKCGFDLTAYKGITVSRWTYTVTDYPGYEDSDSVRLTLLVHNGRVIGGDVCSVELDGFMHELFNNTKDVTDEKRTT